MHQEKQKPGLQMGEINRLVVFYDLQGIMSKDQNFYFMLIALFDLQVM
jgi:hypothetical protein